MLFVKLSSHKKVSAGVGRVGPQKGFAGTSLQPTKTVTLQKVCVRAFVGTSLQPTKTVTLQKVCVRAFAGTSLRKNHLWEIPKYAILGCKRNCVLKGVEFDGKTS